MRRGEGRRKVILNGQRIEQVKNFNYLGTVIEDTGETNKEIDENFEKSSQIVQ